MRLGPIIERIRAETGSIFVSVEPARRLNDFDPDGLPTAYVHPQQESASPSETLNLTSQTRTSQFAVTLAAAHPAFDEDTQVWSEPLEEARNAVFLALIGFEYLDWQQPVEFGNGDVVEVRADFIVWRDYFLVVDFLRSS